MDLELLGLAVRSVAEHETVVGRAYDFGSRLESDLYDRVVSADEPRRDKMERFISDFCAARQLPADFYQQFIALPGAYYDE